MTSRDRDKFRKYVSGAEKARKRKRNEEFMKSQAGALTKFVVQSKPNENDDASPSLNNKSQVNSTSHLAGFVEMEPAQNHKVGCDEHENVQNEFEDSETESSVNRDSYDASDIANNFDYDPASWGEIDSKKRCLIVKKGPIKVSDFDFPKDNENRHFSNCLYNRILPNAESQERKWLIYSKKTNKVYCFCCKLFDLATSNSNCSKLCTSGVNDWKHIQSCLQSHESSTRHIRNIIKWVELESRLHRKITIDKELQEELEVEKTHWQNVLKRIISVIQYLAEHNLAFRGQNEKIYQSDNGNFLGLIEMISEFDPIMKEHLRRIKDNETHVHYLGHRVQNELIEQIGSEVQKTILKKIMDAKYYSIILDCTPDVSHQEQMSLVIRFVSMEPEVKIEERFLQFIPVTDSSGKGLSNVLVSILDNLQLPLENCRGQGYDNGANMKGKEQGVQKRILDINQRAFFTPCSCHNLNLVLGDMAKCIPRAQLFFGITQRLYTIFAESTKGWACLMKHVNGSTLKPLSQTRWECKIQSVKVLRYHCTELLDALSELVEVTNDPVKKSEAESLANQIECFDFVVGICIWYDVLFMVNEVSKTLQAPDIQMDVAVILVKGLVSRLQKYRDSGFKSAMSTANEIAKEINIPAEFKHRRISRKKKHFDEKAEHDEEFLRKSPEELFKIEYFFPLLDQAILSMETRFTQLDDFKKYFDFLYNLQILKSLSDEDLRKHCQALENKLTDATGESHDLDLEDFFNELKLLREVIPDETKTAFEILKLISQMKNSFPNVTIAYRILLTVPVTVASGERSFSKLKLIKNYLRSTITEDRLNGLAIISIEKDIARGLTKADIIRDFAIKKARKVDFSH